MKKPEAYKILDTIGCPQAAQALGVSPTVVYRAWHKNIIPCRWYWHIAELSDELGTFSDLVAELDKIAPREAFNFLTPENKRRFYGRASD